MCNSKIIKSFDENIFEKELDKILKDFTVTDIQYRPIECDGEVCHTCLVVYSEEKPMQFIAGQQPIVLGQPPIIGG